MGAGRGGKVMKDSAMKKTMLLFQKCLSTTVGLVIKIHPKCKNVIKGL